MSVRMIQSALRKMETGGKVTVVIEGVRFVKKYSQEGEEEEEESWYTVTETWKNISSENAVVTNVWECKNRGGELIIVGRLQNEALTHLQIV
jgi:hypothetical protein